MMTVAPLSRGEGRSDWWIVALLFAASFGIRLIRLFDLDLWFDEAVIALQLDKSFADIWNICKTDNYPPLYVWVMKIWASVVPGENSLRVGTALLGSLTPPAAFFLGKILLDRRLGWVLGIVCIISPSLIYQQQMIRMYSLLTFFSCLSLIGFFRALRTQGWRDWTLMAVANLLGFYTFLFMGFLILAEFLVILWHFRIEFPRYLRPVLAHMPALLLMLIWMFPALQRAQVLQEEYMVFPFTLHELGKLWIYFGTRTDFGNNYDLTLFLNLPLLVGVILAIIRIRRYPPFGIAAALLIVPIVIVAAISLGRQSIFLQRYFILLLPIYLGLAVGGWLALPRAMIRRAGLVLLLLVMFGSCSYCFADYFDQHREYGFIHGFGPDGVDNGHAVSQAAQFLQKRIGPDEVIVHFSNPGLCTFSFFPMVWYHHYALPEFLYSVDDVPGYLGRQYLRPGDQIRSLSDLQPPPAGVWLVSVDSTEIFFDDSSAMARIVRSKWLDRWDLPRELDQAGYALKETARLGRVTLLDYRKVEDDR